MKTTIEISDTLLEQAKTLSSERGWTMRMVFEESLRSYLAKQTARTKPFRFRPHVVKGRGLQPGIEWSQLSQLVREDLDRQS